MNKEKHIHAELMLEFAKDAMKSQNPGELWEYKEGELDWITLNHRMPIWDEETQYRRKIPPIIINGLEVPQPERKPLEERTTYYMPTLINNKGFTQSYWSGDPEDEIRLKRGLVHLTKKAAKLHADALISFTKEPAWRG